MVRSIIRSRFFAVLFAIALIVGAIGGSSYFASASPSHGPAIVNSVDSSAGQTAKRVTYVDAGVHTMANTTPVSSGSQCQQYGDLHKIEVRVVGTMAGTAPSLTLQPRNSIDGVNWTNQGTAVVINATTTPASSTFTFADQRGQSVYNATVAAVVTAPPVAYGECWDILQTWAGTGTVTASYKIVGVDK